MATEVAMLLFRGLKLILVSSQFLTSTRWMCLCSGRSWLGLRTLEAGRVAAVGTECSLFSRRPSLLLNGATRSEPLFVRETAREDIPREGSVLFRVQRFAGPVKQDDLRCQCPWRQKQQVAGDTLEAASCWGHPI
eukprot:1160752-Pelagomonas_calceolata.AAC.3